MKIRHIRTLAGPNIYNHKPVLLMALDLEELSETASDELPGFVDRLLSMLPGLHEHGCSKGKPGGFVERLYSGTYVGHIVEHVALELTEPVGIRATYGKTLSTDEPSVYTVVVEYTAEHAMRYLLELAVDLISALVAGKSFSLLEPVAEAKRIVARTELGPSTRAIVDAAVRRGIPWTRLNDANLVRLGYGKQRKYIEATVSSHTSHIAVEIAQDKHLTKTLLQNAAIPVPRGHIVRTAEEAVVALANLGSSVVVKPLDGNQGKGCSLNLTTAAEVTEAFDLGAAIYAPVVGEVVVGGGALRGVVV
jgi:cyanophycin synthetase